MATPHVIAVRSLFAVGAVALFALAAAATGCGNQGCIQKSSTPTNTCPTQTQANTLLTGACNKGRSSEGRVESVDSDPNEDDDLCCYDVTLSEDDGCVAGADD